MREPCSVELLFNDARDGITLSAPTARELGALVRDAHRMGLFPRAVAAQPSPSVQQRLAQALQAGVITAFAAAAAKHSIAAHCEALL